MAERVADRPHAITILLSILAALISALGVYLAYEKSLASASPTATSALNPEKEQRKQPPEAAPLDEAGRKRLLEEGALEAAKKSILGVWTCTAADPKKIDSPQFDVSVYADNTLDVYNAKKWPDHGNKKPSPFIDVVEFLSQHGRAVPYKFIDSTHVQVQQMSPDDKKNRDWDTYTVGVVADKSNQHVHSDNDDQISCVRK